MLRRVLLPGGVFIAQILNYDKILGRGERHLPLNFRPQEDGTELVFLRLMREGSDGTILFFPTTLALDPEAEVPVTVKSTRRVPLRPWTREDLLPVFERGFDVRTFGDMEGGPFTAESNDLVLVATRRPGGRQGSG